MAARYCYNGPAFRFQAHGVTAAHPNEFRQAGVELFGDIDREQAEVDVLALVMKALRAAGLDPSACRVRLGDLALFHALLADLDLPERGRQRLRAQFWRPDAFRSALTRLSSSPAGSIKGLPADLVATLDTLSEDEAEAAVSHYLERHDIALVGARTVCEITANLQAAVIDARSEPISSATASLIERYLRIKGPVRAVADDVRASVAAVGPRSALALLAYQRRLDLLEDAGIDLAGLEFGAEFGRNLEYYTGFVFDIVSPELGPASPIAGGGRYDRLMQAVGAPGEVAAVGSAIHTERLLDAVGAARGSDRGGDRGITGGRRG